MNQESKAEGIQELVKVVIVIRDAGLAGKYEENWKVHAGHSEGYEGKGM